MFHFETDAAQPAPKNKKEVKTGSFSPPGVVGCCMTIPSAAQQARPARQVCGLTRDCFVQFVRRLTTKELVFLRFVALQNARVNGKKWNRPCGKMLPFRVSQGSRSRSVACSEQR